MTIDAKNTATDDTKVDDVNVDAGGDEGGEDEQVDWQARATAAEKALNKEKAIRKAAQEKAKNAGKDSEGQDYKKHFEQSEAKLSKVLARQKQAEISVAATAQLTKLGVTADAMPAALKLIDINSVEWDEEDGVDSTSVKAAVQTLRNEYGFMFDKKVPGVKPANQGTGKNLGSEENTMTRAEFDKLSPAMKSAKATSKGFKVVND